MTNSAERDAFEKWYAGSGIENDDTSAKTAARIAWNARAQASGVPDGSVSKEAKADLLACDWLEGNLFYVQDEPGEHDPCYLVMPDGAMLAFNHHASNGVDQARAQFIADCCNQVLSPIQAPTTPKSASVPVERLEALIAEWDKPPRQLYAVAELAELIAEYKA